MNFGLPDLASFSTFPRFNKPLKTAIGILYANMNLLFIHLAHLVNVQYLP